MITAQQRKKICRWQIYTCIIFHESFAYPTYCKIKEIEGEENEREGEREIQPMKHRNINKSYYISGPHIRRTWNCKLDNEFGGVTMDRENYLHLKLDYFFHSG